ncbi:MAG: flavodoxin-dependent (E)-4-hydroxy-3-methylbut-2-enyl-diphosphate synthase [Kiritimatiellia bacterium]|nr:flavodoxin-dependent (E)-4-hydroxy-3-methylbut-2-enyl-diphosphate synthase [Kiritimatiellia bacterium]
MKTGSKVLSKNIPSPTPPLIIKRRLTRKVYLGRIEIGGNAPISVQAMTKTPTVNIKATVNQIHGLEQIGCDIIRVAVPNMAAARALPAILRAIHIPLIADIHFDYRLALAAIAGGVDGLRINPGNIGSKARIREIVRAASEKNLSIRIGVNAGSLEKDILAKYGAPTAKALVDSALTKVKLLEDLGQRAIKISVKASDVVRTVEAYRRLSKATDHPLHLGVTEAGTLLCGAVRSSVALGVLLTEGIGDTIRVSLADEPANEVRAGREILRSLGLHSGGPRLIVCPTCARAQMNVIKLAHTIEKKLEKLEKENPQAKTWPAVAVMGCAVNGPGEARATDIAVVCGKNKVFLYLAGVKTVALDAKLVPAVVAEQVIAFCSRKSD